MDYNNLEKRIDNHDIRLRAVEQSLSILPRMEKKIDQLVEADHGGSLAVMKVEARARDKEIAELRTSANQTTEKFWKVAIVIALILGALQGVGIDLTTALKETPAQSIVEGP